MRMLLSALIFATALAQGQELAQPVAPVAAAAAPVPSNLVAQTAWPNTHRISLLRDSCGWPGGARRAQWILPDRSLRWGCWGYNATGVQITWQTGRTQWIDFLELWAWENGRPYQMGYQTLARRLEILDIIHMD